MIAAVRARVGSVLERIAARVDQMASWVEGPQECWPVDWPPRHWVIMNGEWSPPAETVDNPVDRQSDHRAETGHPAGTGNSGYLRWDLDGTWTRDEPTTPLPNDGLARDHSHDLARKAAVEGYLEADGCDLVTGGADQDDFNAAKRRERERGGQ